MATLSASKPSAALNAGSATSIAKPSAAQTAKPSASTNAFKKPKPELTQPIIPPPKSMARGSVKIKAKAKAAGGDAAYAGNASGATASTTGGAGRAASTGGGCGVAASTTGIAKNDGKVVRRRNPNEVAAMLAYAKDTCAHQLRDGYVGQC